MEEKQPPRFLLSSLSPQERIDYSHLIEQLGEFSTLGQKIPLLQWEITSTAWRQGNKSLTGKKDLPSKFLECFLPLYSPSDKIFLLKHASGCDKATL